MKIIDLLNKIANGEEVPEKIKAFNNEYVWRKDLARYVLRGCENGNIAGHTFADTRNIFACLHDKVEVIEEDKKIDYMYHFKHETKQEIDMINKINEIIDILNKEPKELHYSMDDQVDY